MKIRRERNKGSEREQGRVGLRKKGKIEEGNARRIEEEGE